VKTSILYSVKIGGYAVEVKNVENLLNSIFVLSKFKDYEIHLFHSDELKTDVLSFLKKVKNEKVTEEITDLTDQLTLRKALLEKNQK